MDNSIAENQECKLGKIDCPFNIENKKNMIKYLISY